MGVVHWHCFRGGQVPFSAACALGKLAIVEPKKVPDPTPVNGYPFEAANIRRALEQAHGKIR